MRIAYINTKSLVSLRFALFNKTGESFLIPKVTIKIRLIHLYLYFLYAHKLHIALQLLSYSRMSYRYTLYFFFRLQLKIT